MLQFLPIVVVVLYLFLSYLCELLLMFLINKYWKIDAFLFQNKNESHVYNNYDWKFSRNRNIFSERELMFMFAICHRLSVCRLSVVCRLFVVCL